MTESTLDFTTGSQAEQAERLKENFNALSQGEALNFTTTADPRGLIRTLLPNLWGQFDWAPLEEGEGRWLSRIVKRSEQGPTGLMIMMKDDHRRCDELFAASEAAAQQGNMDDAQTSFEWFKVGMERHFRMEEEGFFKDLDRAMGLGGGGPVAVMRDEHQQIRGLLRRMADALTGANQEAYLGAADTLVYLMEQHNMKEEHMLYPMAQNALGADMDSLLQRLIVL